MDYNVNWIKSLILINYKFFIMKRLLFFLLLFFSFMLIIEFVIVQEYCIVVGAWFGYLFFVFFKYFLNDNGYVVEVYVGICGWGYGCWVNISVGY